MPPPGPSPRASLQPPSRGLMKAALQEVAGIRHVAASRPRGCIVLDLCVTPPKRRSSANTRPGRLGRLPSPCVPAPPTTLIENAKPHRCSQLRGAEWPLGDPGCSWTSDQADTAIAFT
ncbi:hypothetical protein AAFF_G00157750 [Aldrovandia affinis]|uniref:Uncharacterized protein n=1 Tax=Aldrovandia affinis TaxID=143900 RepID=A0AAD7RN71_9TELE|nr:hypothetical protein AAFF_G00157750 [Aldrovandia affinis]